MQLEYINICLLCENQNFSTVFNFKNTPLANELSEYKDLIVDDLFPLCLKVCNNCKNYQLSHVIDPVRLFRDYLYVSGTSSATQKYAENYAKHTIQKFSLKEKSRILDIGSNDGTYLKYFEELGMIVRGVDPAREIVNKAQKNGITTTPSFFNTQYVNLMLESYALFDVIISNNTFAHIKNLSEVVEGIYKLLEPDGLFIFENSYLLDIIENNLWDTIYHEHIFTHSLIPLVKFFNKFGMKIIDVERTENQGGSIRVYCAKKASIHKVSENALKHIENEKNKPTEFFKEFETNILKSIKNIDNALRSLSGKTIDIFGFPAKTTTLLYSLNDNWNSTKSLFRNVYDDAPLKQNKYTPGMHLPILPSSKLIENNPDYLFIGAWNFADSIMKKCRENGYKGKFIIPLPELRIE